MDILDKFIIKAIRENTEDEMDVSLGNPPLIAEILQDVYSIDDPLLKRLMGLPMLRLLKTVESQGVTLRKIHDLSREMWAAAERIADWADEEGLSGEQKKQAVSLINAAQDMDSLVSLLKRPDAAKLAQQQIEKRPEVRRSKMHVVPSGE